MHRLARDILFVVFLVFQPLQYEVEYFVSTPLLYYLTTNLEIIYSVYCVRLCLSPLQHFDLCRAPLQRTLAAMADLVDSMLDLMRRLPPTRVEENVAALVGICPDYADDLLGSVDQPLQLRTDRATGKEYLACDYNRDGESYR